MIHVSVFVEVVDHVTNHPSYSRDMVWSLVILFHLNYIKVSIHAALLQHNSFLFNVQDRAFLYKNILSGLHIMRHRL